ncbi:hypothetical protein [Rhizobium sp. SGZ-381]
MNPASLEWNHMPPANLVRRAAFGLRAVADDLANIIFARIWLWRARHGI